MHLLEEDLEMERSGVSLLEWGRGCGGVGGRGLRMAKGKQERLPPSLETGTGLG